MTQKRHRTGTERTRATPARLVFPFVDSFHSLTESAGVLHARMARAHCEALQGWRQTQNHKTTKTAKPTKRLLS